MYRWCRYNKLIGCILNDYKQVLFLRDLYSHESIQLSSKGRFFSVYPSVMSYYCEVLNTLHVKTMFCSSQLLLCGLLFDFFLLMVLMLIFMFHVYISVLTVYHNMSVLLLCTTNVILIKTYRLTPIFFLI